MSILNQDDFWIQEHNRDFTVDLFREPLVQRAWTLQGRFLSSRVLHFGTKQLYWECNRLATSQTNLVDISIGIKGITDDEGLLWKRRTSPEAQRESNLQQCYQLIEDYSCLALSGIPKRYEAMLSDIYLAGLWGWDFAA